MRHTKVFLDDQCPLCRKVFANVYLKRRHMGAVHGMDKDCHLISNERRDYLRLQSARKYVRNRHRQMDNERSPTTVSTSQRPSFDQTTVDKDEKFEGTDHASPDYRMESNDRSDADIEDELFRRIENVVYHVCKQKQKNKVLPAYTQPLKWSSY